MNPPINNRPACPPVTREMLYSRNGLTRFMESAGFRYSRALGQNFLINRRVMESVLDAIAFPRSGRVIEIGPGLGQLTWLILERGADVVAVERDRWFAAWLPEMLEQFDFGAARLRVIQQDALETDFRQLAEEHQAARVIGNLPYNVSVPILFHLAYCGFRFEQTAVMLQKEVGERILAHPGTKSYGRLSIVLKYLFSIQKVKTIDPGSFCPRPHVESVFLTLEPLPDADVEFARLFLERVIHIGFLHRRKKLRKQLQGAIVQRRVLDADFLREAEQDFNLDDRAEAWPIETWVRFAELVRSRQPVE